MVINPGWGASYTYTYELLEHPEGSRVYQLEVSVTSSLYGYYRSRDHQLYSYEFAKFVTPYALEPIADSLWKIYDNAEDFANGVLMILHQIPYVESGPQKYPVETIVENEGDCDLFSLTAASVMKAGGLDVVLLLYETQSHMNVGVNLPQDPTDARSAISYYTHNGKTYYVAECTGGNWRTGWRVGECPEMLVGDTAQIITLENCEQTAPGQVTASYESLADSSLTLELSSTFAITGNLVEIRGALSPALSGKNITVYVTRDSRPWEVLTHVTSDDYGRISYAWTPTLVGSYVVRASWSGDQDHIGADSSGHTIIVVPLEWIMIGIMVIVLLGVLAVVSITGRQAREETERISEAEFYNLI